MKYQCPVEHVVLGVGVSAVIGSLCITYTMPLTCEQANQIKWSDLSGITMQNQNPLQSGLLEMLSIAADIAVPLILSLVGYRVHKLTSAIEHSQWLNQKMIEKRISVFEEVGPRLNDLYCYMMWLGNWKELSPLQIVEHKRRLDKAIHINEFLFSDALLEHYFAFIHTCFRTHQGRNVDARLRTPITSKRGDRRKTLTTQWEPEWERYFVAECHEPRTESCDWSSRAQIEETYKELMRQFASEIGVERRVRVTPAEERKSKLRQSAD